MKRRLGGDFSKNSAHWEEKKTKKRAERNTRPRNVAGGLR